LEVSISFKFLHLKEILRLIQKIFMRNLFILGKFLNLNLCRGLVFEQKWRSVRLLRRKTYSFLQVFKIGDLLFFCLEDLL
jgi:hypothetical protein